MGENGDSAYLCKIRQALVKNTVLAKGCRRFDKQIVGVLTNVCSGVSRGVFWLPGTPPPGHDFFLN